MKKLNIVSAHYQRKLFRNSSLPVTVTNTERSYSNATDARRGSYSYLLLEAKGT